VNPWTLITYRVIPLICLIIIPLVFTQYVIYGDQVSVAAAASYPRSFWLSRCPQHAGARDIDAWCNKSRADDNHNGPVAAVTLAASSPHCCGTQSETESHTFTIGTSTPSWLER
jgi:hypothetical protein